MAMFIKDINRVAPITSAGTGNGSNAMYNNASLMFEMEVLSFQRPRRFMREGYVLPVVRKNFQKNDLLNLNPQSLDMLNGIEEQAATEDA